jgi:hypothetical protein
MLKEIEIPDFRTNLLDLLVAKQASAHSHEVSWLVVYLSPIIIGSQDVYLCHK